MLTYEDLEKKYDYFEKADYLINIENKIFNEENKIGAYIDNIEVKLSSETKASTATFCIYNCFREYPGSFETEQLRAYLNIGSKVEIFLGHGNFIREVFVGLITNVGFSYGNKNDAFIKVTAMDVMVIMQNNTSSKETGDKRFSDVIKAILNSSIYQQQWNSEIIRNMIIEDTPDKPSETSSPPGKTSEDSESAETTVKMETDYDFIKKVAIKFIYEFFVHCGVIYFRKSKSNEATLLKIGIDDGLKSLNIGYNICNAVKNLVVRHYNSDDTKKTHEVQKKISSGIISGNKFNGIISEKTKVIEDSAVKTEQEVALRAEQELAEIEYSIASINATLVGIPELEPGRFIEIIGLKIPQDNKFYITEITHTMSLVKGYSTKIRGCGRGMGS